MTLRSPVPRAENSPHVTLKQKSTVGPKYKQLRTLQSTASTIRYYTDSNSAKGSAREIKI